MSKIQLDNITSGFSTQKINDNFQKIEDQINNKMLSRQPGTEPNVMLDVLDMNSNRIINLPAPTSPTEPVRLQDVDIDISQVNITSDFALIRATLEPSPLDGKAWFDKDKTLYIGDGGIWKPVSGSTGEGGGIVYSNELPLALTEGVTFFDAEKLEHVYSYADDDSVQYLAVPLLAGSGGSAATSGGSAEGYSTFITADPDGVSLVASGSSAAAHLVKGLKAGEGVVLETTGSAVTIKADVTNAVSAGGVELVTTNVATPKKVVKKLKAGTGVTLNDTGTDIVINSTGGTGSGTGISYVESYPSSFTSGSTLYFPETNEQAYSYSDGDSEQYLVYPLMGGSPAGSVESGGSSVVITQSGSGTDGAATFTIPTTGTYSFKRLKAGALNNIILTENTNNIVIEGLDIVNAGSSGASLVKTKTSTQVPIKRVLAGTNVTITEGTDAITINSTASGGGALGDTLTRLQAITPSTNNVPYFTGASADQFPTTASTRAMMGLNTVANTIPYFTGTSSAGLTSLAPFMLTMLGMTGVPSALAHLKITSGSNANGNWLRIGTGDTAGVQICWHRIVTNGATTGVGSSFTGTNATWTFPQAFAGGTIPSVTGTLIDGVVASVIGGSAGVSSTAATLRQLAPTTTANADTAVIAVGFY